MRGADGRGKKTEEVARDNLKFYLWILSPARARQHLALPVPSGLPSSLFIIIDSFSHLHHRIRPILAINSQPRLLCSLGHRKSLDTFPSRTTVLIITQRHPFHSLQSFSRSRPRSFHRTDW